MNEYLKGLVEARTKVAHDIEAIRKEWTGNEGQMPPEVEEKLDKALVDYDGIGAKIQREERSQRVSDALNAPGREPVAGAPAPFSQKSAQRLAVEKFLTQGFSSMDDVERKNLSVGNGPQAGYLVGQEVSSEILAMVRDQVFIRAAASVDTLTRADSMTFNRRSAEVADFDWTAELLTGDEDTAMAYGRTTLTPKPCAKRIRVSRTLLRMTGGVAENEVLSSLAYKRARTEEYAFLYGAGLKGPLGLLVESNNGLGTGRNVNTATANVIAADDLIGMLALLKGHYRPRAKWMIHRNCEGRLRKLKDSTNNYIWQPFPATGQFLVGGMPGTILGLPYVVSELMPDTALTGNVTTGTFPVLLGDFSAYRIVDTLADEVQRLEELYATTNEVGFIYRFESDGAPVIDEAFSRMKVS